MPACASEICAKGLFTLREGDPRRRNNFKSGLHAEISVRVVPKWRRVEKELKMEGDKKQKCNLDPSAFFAGVDNYLSTELS